MAAAEFFDYHAAASAAGFSPEQLAELECIVRSDYPHDDMLFELHVFRACRAVGSGRASIADVLRPDNDRGISAA